MKVTNNKDSVELSHLSRSKKSDKGAALKAKEAELSAGTGISAGTASEVSLSDEAKAINSARQIAKSQDVDQAKIDRIKAMINGGTYKPDYGKVADKVVNESLLQELS